jgi:hypothetical protein
VWLNFLVLFLPCWSLRTVCEEITGMVLSSFRLLINKVMLNFCRLKKRRIEIRNFLKNLFYIFVSLVILACQHLKKQAVQVVIVFDFVKVEKRKGFVAFVIGMSWASNNFKNKILFIQVMESSRATLKSFSCVCFQTGRAVQVG